MFKGEQILYNILYAFCLDVISYSSSSSSSSLFNIIFYSYFYILSMSPISIIPPPIMTFNIAISILFYMPISSTKSPRSPIPPIIINVAKSFIYFSDGFLLRPFALTRILFVLLVEYEYSLSFIWLISA